MAGKRTVKVEIDLDGSEVLAIRVDGKDITEDSGILSINRDSTDEWVLVENEDGHDLILVRTEA